MTKFCSGNEVWDELSKVSKRKNVKKIIAVPYVGMNGCELFDLKKGDVLVCAISESNVKNGTVCPETIDIYFKKGVRIFIHDYLHAKVYFWGDGAFVTSANISTKSKEQYDEAGVILGDKRNLNLIAMWLNKLCHTPLTEEWLEYLKGKYKKPLYESNFDRAIEAQTWLIWLPWVDDFDNKDVIIEKIGASKSNKYRKKKDKKNYYIDSFWYPTHDRSNFIKNSKRGDIVVQIMNSGEVYEPATIINKKDLQDNKRTIVYLEAHKNPYIMPYMEFKNACRDFNLNLGDNIQIKLVKNKIERTKISQLLYKAR